MFGFSKSQKPKAPPPVFINTYRFVVRKDDSMDELSFQSLLPVRELLEEAKRAGVNPNGSWYVKITAELKHRFVEYPRPPSEADVLRIIEATIDATLDADHAAHETTMRLRPTDTTFWFRDLEDQDQMWVGGENTNVLAKAILTALRDAGCRL